MKMRVLCTATVLALLNLISCEATGKEEIVPMDSGRRNRFGLHEYCGPYKNHYIKSQDCHEVGLYYHKKHRTHNRILIQVNECEELCNKRYRCNAINWSPNEDLGCVLRECGFSDQQNQPRPFPMPLGYNKDWISFSKYQPVQIPECKKKSGSYDTLNNYYCGPYNKLWHPQQCPEFGDIIRNVQLLECESKCDDHVRCTGIHYASHRNACTLVACTGSVERKPMQTVRFGAAIKSYSKFRLPGSECILDDRR